MTFTGPAEPLAAQVALEGGYAVQPAGYLGRAGALLTLTGVNLGIPSLEIATMPRATADAVWSQQKRAIMTAVGCGTPMPFVPVPNQPRAAEAGSRPAGHGSARRRPPIAAVPSDASAMGAASPSRPPRPCRRLRPCSQAADAPQALNFSELRFGRPTVQVESPRAHRSRQTAASSSALRPQAGVAVS